MSTQVRRVEMRLHSGAVPVDTVRQEFGDFDLEYNLKRGTVAAWCGDNLVATLYNDKDGAMPSFALMVAMETFAKAQRALSDDDTITLTPAGLAHVALDPATIDRDRVPGL